MAFKSQNDKSCSNSAQKSLRKNKDTGHKITNIRAKLQSMHDLKNGFPNGNLGLVKKAIKGQNKLKKLENSIQKYNKQAEDPQTDQSQIPQDKQEILHVQDRLWHYFQNKIEVFEGKVEKQKVNGWKKILQTILNQTDKKIVSNQNNLLKIDNIIRSKYKQTHQIYQQVQSIKLQQVLQAKSATTKRKRIQIETGRGQKINALNQNLKSLKEQIQEIQKDKATFQVQIRKMKAQRKSILLNFLKNGLYLHDGVKKILYELTTMKHKILQTDFPSILDNRSKFYLIQQYNSLFNQQNNNHQGRQICLSKTIQVRPTKTKSTLGLLTEKQKLKDIYGSAQAYLSTLMKVGQLRREQFKLPEIKTHRKHIQEQCRHLNRTEIQKRRIQMAYSGERLEHVKKILFGVRVETILND